ncbi:unnamed protein product [Acanthoscelides obtectus]|uniref:Uncharacterized protein n=1 Tax=Acanthoscelides obtectus TaxID=200917 RepID=A0A9P0MFE6_ACAOB|nr:unnamed protein product [Acanthoscelides obtectus]
MNAILFEE